jgi:hypothetical protein
VGWAVVVGSAVVGRDVEECGGGAVSTARPPVGAGSPGSVSGSADAAAPEAGDAGAGLMRLVVPAGGRSVAVGSL